MNLRTTCLACVLPALLWAGPAPAQSTEASELAALSLSPSVELAAEVLAAVPAGSELVVSALRPLAGSVEVVLVSAAGGASLVLELSAQTLRAVGLVAGSVVVVTVASGGYVLSVGGELLAFIPDALTRAMIHHAELHRWWDPLESTCRHASLSIL